MSNHYILTSSGNFIVLNDDELMHWKYIKKEKVNGKWRYYYNVGDAGYIDGYTGKKPSSIVGYSWLEDKLGYDERERANRANANYKRADKDSHNRSYPSASDAHNAFSKVQELGKKAIEANNAYMRTPLGQLEYSKVKIQKAKTKVSSWLRKVFKKKKKIKLPPPKGAGWR